MVHSSCLKPGNFLLKFCFYLLFIFGLSPEITVYMYIIATKCPKVNGKVSKKVLCSFRTIQILGPNILPTNYHDNLILQLYSDL